MVLVLLIALLALGTSAAQAPSTSTLDIYIRAAGQPAVARVYILNEGGEVQRIPGALFYSQGGEEHAIVDQSASVSLPAGEYRIRAEKGPEFRLVEKMVELTAGEPARVDLDLPLFHNMNERGWYSGDLHLHRTAAEAALLLRAEALNVGPVISRHLRETPREYPGWPTAQVSGTPGNYLVSVHNLEVERPDKGHGAMLLLNTPQPVEGPLRPLHPPDTELARRARSLGAFVDVEKPIWKLAPVGLALGWIDSIGLVNDRFQPRGMPVETEKYGAVERDKAAYQTAAGLAQWMMDLYYSFLNSGFRVPVSAGSASGIMPVWPGYARVYVHLSGPFDYGQWFRDLKAGRTVATNGPLLEVFVDGEPPGAEFPWQSPAATVILIEAHSQTPLDRVEIIFNGDVIRALPAGGNAVLRTALNVTITEPGWLAVRCFEAGDETVRYAHTSPFYFVRDGRTAVKPAAALHWADYVRGLASALDPADFPSRPDYDLARSVLQQAETAFRRQAR